MIPKPPLWEHFSPRDRYAWYEEQIARIKELAREEHKAINVMVECYEQHFHKLTPTMSIVACICGELQGSKVYKQRADYAEAELARLKEQRPAPG